MMCRQMLNNDYVISETGKGSGVVGRSPAYSRVSILVQTYKNLLRKNVCTHIYSFFNPKSSDEWQLL